MATCPYGSVGRCTWLEVSGRRKSRVARKIIEGESKAGKLPVRHDGLDVKEEQKIGWNESHKEDPKNPLAGRIQGAAEENMEVRNFYGEREGTCRDATCLRRGWGC